MPSGRVLLTIVTIALLLLSAQMRELHGIGFTAINADHVLTTGGIARTDRARATASAAHAAPVAARRV